MCLVGRYALLNQSITWSSAVIVGCWWSRKHTSKPVNGDCTFAVAAATVSNSPSRTVSTATTTSQFTRLLKTDLFTLGCGWSLTVLLASLICDLQMHHGAIVLIVWLFDRLIDWGWVDWPTDYWMIDWLIAVLLSISPCVGQQMPWGFSCKITLSSLCEVKTFCSFVCVVKVDYILSLSVVYQLLICPT